MKETYYFSHDSNARNDDKLIAVRMRLGAEGYGIYFMIIERLLEATNYMSAKDYNIIAFDLRVSAEKVKSIIEDFNLFEFSDDGKKFFSKSLIARMKPLDNLREQRRQAGLKSAEKRAKIKEIATTAERPLGEKPTKERKGKESIGNESKGDENESEFSTASTQQILLSKTISIDQWAIMFHVSVSRIKECIAEFSDFKERHGENTWKNESDLSKNFEFWLRSNAVKKTEKIQNLKTNGNLRQPKRR